MGRFAHWDFSLIVKPPGWRFRWRPVKAGRGALIPLPLRSKKQRRLRFSATPSVLFEGLSVISRGRIYAAIKSKPLPGSTMKKLTATPLSRAINSTGSWTADLPRHARCLAPAPRAPPRFDRYPAAC